MARELLKRGAFNRLPGPSTREVINTLGPQLGFVAKQAWRTLKKWTDKGWYVLPEGVEHFQRMENKKAMIRKEIESATKWELAPYVLELFERCGANGPCPQENHDSWMIVVMSTQPHVHIGTHMVNVEKPEVLLDLDNLYPVSDAWFAEQGICVHEEGPKMEEGFWCGPWYIADDGTPKRGLSSAIGPDRATARLRAWALALC